MATNLYTPVVTGGGYRIIPETGANVGNASTFSPAETYKFSSDGYYNQGDTALGDAFGGMANDLGAYSSYANSAIAGYDALLNYLRGNEAGLQRVSKGVYDELRNGMQTDYDYVNRMFGPDGELTREVNTYYDDLGNYLATDAGRQAATITAQGMHSGASLGAIRAQQNKAYNESFARYVQAKEQEINAKQTIASNLINYMSTLRREYGDTTNQYIIEMYKRANDLYNQTAISLANDLNQFNALRISGSGSGGSSSNSLSSLGLTPRENGTYIDTNGNTYKVNTDGKIELVTKGVVKKGAQDKLGQTLPGGKTSNVDWAGLGWKAMTAPYTYLNPFYRVEKGTEGLINSMK